MAKGTATSNKMMPRMDTWGGQNDPGYVPPKGNAGSMGKGEYSSKSNPLSKPKVGSEIGAGYGNADRMKIMREERAQAAKESLRGQPC